MIRKNLQHIEPVLNKLGFPLLYTINGMVVAIPQFDQIDELRGKEIDLQGHAIVVKNIE